MNDAPISIKEQRKARAMVRDISKQVPFKVGDTTRMLSPDEWWVFIFACLYGQKTVENPFYGELPSAPLMVVENKKRTKDLTVSTGAELITILYAFGNNHGVKWSDPKWIAEMEAYEKENRRLVA